MIGSSKILTVSYGTFSCTLEGFEDSFGTMTAIAEYFRDLAADDRYFGAEPPTPDTEMLARIAEAQSRRRIEARSENGGVVLRAALAPTSLAGDADRRAETSNRSPGAAATARGEPVDAADAAVGAERSQLLADPAPAASHPGEADLPDFIDDDSDQDDGVTTDLATDPVARPMPVEGADDDSLAAKLRRIRAVVGQGRTAAPFAVADDVADAEAPEEDVARDEDAPGTDDAIAAALTGDDLDATADDDIMAEPLAGSDGDHESEAEALATTEPRAEPPEALRLVPMREDEGDAEDEDRDEASGEDEALTEAFLEDLAALTGDREEETAGDHAEDAADHDALLSRLAGETGEDEAAPATAEDDTDVLGGIAAALMGHGFPDAEMDADEGDAFERDFADARGMVEEEDDAPDHASEAAAATDGDPLGQETDEAPVDALEDEDAGDDVKETASAPFLLQPEALARDEDEDQDRDGDEDRAEDASPSDHRARSLLDQEPDEEGVSRLYSRADGELSTPEVNQRREALSQLKAAVLAAEAARELGEERRGTASESAFRNDLREVVRPRRPVLSGDARSDRPRQAPLKLVASQRIDTPREEPTIRPTVVDPVRPRRVSIDETATPNRDSGGFAAFAAGMGARDLIDLLEAAAAYTSFVEGMDDFSRPQLIAKVREAADQAYTREDELRSFGTLLRQGRLSKVRNGRFQVAESTRFHPERQAG